MGCSHCQDGWIYIDDGARACVCQRMAESEFRSAYSPGGLSGRARKRARARCNGRKGGLASGVKRRQLAKGRRRTRDGGLGVPHAYGPVPWLSRDELEVMFRRECAEQGRRFHQAGFDTTAAVYRPLRCWLAYKGQDFELTNENVQIALERLGRPRCRRTVQYTRARLARMGVFTCAHVKRSGPLRRPGAMDTIRIRFLRGVRKHCTPQSSTAQPSGPLRGPESLAVAERPPIAETPADVAGEPSTTGTERGAARPLTAAEDLQRQLSFDELKRQAGWSVPRRWLYPGADGDG